MCVRGREIAERFQTHRSYVVEGRERGVIVDACDVFLCGWRFREGRRGILDPTIQTVPFDFCYERTRGKRRTTDECSRDKKQPRDTLHQLLRVFGRRGHKGGILAGLYSVLFVRECCTRTISVYYVSCTSYCENVQSMSVKCLSSSSSRTSQQQNNTNAGRLLGGDGKKKEAGEHVRYRRVVYKGRPSRQKSRRVADTQVEGVDEIVEEVSPVPCQFLPD